MPRIPANSGNFMPLPIDEIFVARITGVQEQPPPKEHPEWSPAVNVEFTIVEGEYADRKAWRNFPQSWPTADKTGSTLLFDLFLAFDPPHAIKGSDCDTDNLLGKLGRIQMENKIYLKGPDKGKPNLDANGNQRQQPKNFYPLKGSKTQAAEAPVATEPALTGGPKVGF